MNNTLKYNDIGGDNDHYDKEYTDIVIVGAGVAGTSTLHHLLPYNKNIVVIDAGSAPGHGFDSTAMTSTSTTSTSNPQQQQQQQDTESSDILLKPRYSGTAVFMDDIDAQMNPTKNTSIGSDDEGIACTSTDTKHRSATSLSYSVPDDDATATTVGSLDASKQERKIIKMMVQIFACSIDTFISHHGVHGAQIYLECTRHGLQIQKRIAKDLVQIAATSRTILHELGSLYFALKDDVDALKKEYHHFISLGTDLFDNNGIEWYEMTVEDDNDNSVLYNPDRSRSICLSKQNSFHGAIYFPNDAIIDSSEYSKLLLHNATQHNEENNDHIQSQIGSRMNTIVTHIERLDQMVRYPGDDTSITQHSNSVNTRSEDSTKDPKMYSAIVTCYDTIAQRTYRIYCRHVIVAIGGLSVPQGCCIEDLYGIIRPCYSYLAHVPMKHPMKCHFVNDIVATPKGNNTFDDSRSLRSPNFFTWNFTHDWCYTDPHHIRVSGEDHYSARKDAQQSKRCQNLIRWTYEQYSTDSMDDVHNDSANRSGERSMDHNLSPIIPQQSGVYTETPDCAPVIGSIASDTNNTICYIVGCNAWGQAILSYAATLVPPLLGYRPMTALEYDAMKVLSIQRFPNAIAAPMRPR